MKKDEFKIYLLILLFLYTNYIQGQQTTPVGAVPFECRVLNQGGGGGSLQQTATCSPDFLRDYNVAPIITVFVNVHIWNTNENLSTATLLSRARQMIDETNATLNDMQQNFRAGPGGQPAPRVEDAKYRLKLYTDPVSDPSDINGGIWVYNTPLEFPVNKDILDIGPNSTQFPSYQDKYGDNAIDILLVNYRAKPYSSPPPNFITNSTGYVRGVGGKYVILADLNGGFEADALNGTTNRSDLIWRSTCRALNHEIAHILSLEHSFECGRFNNCPDIDAVQECGSTCPTFSTCGGANNQTKCPGTTRNICSYGQSWNIMAYDWWANAITRCQWERVYNYSINTSFAAVKACATTTSLNLTTSPLADYRASQQIASTSVVNAGRDVTYQAPSIKLNAGFRVALGAAFLAAPSTFPCCDAPPSSIVVADEAELVLYNKNNEDKEFEVFPNPFNNEIKIQFPKTSIFHNQTETQLNLNIVDMNGKTVYSAVISPLDETIISTKNFTSGIYVIKLLTGNIEKTYRIVKI